MGLPVVQIAAGIGADGMVKSGLGAWGRLWRTQRAGNGAAAGMNFQVVKFLPVIYRPSEAYDFRRPVVSRWRIDNLFYRPPCFRILRLEIVDIPLDFLIVNPRIIEIFFI